MLPGRLAERLAEDGPRVLAGVEPERLLDVWSDTVEEFRDHESAARRGLDGPLAERCRLSPAGLEAALEVILNGVRRPAARRIFEAARGRTHGGGLVVVVLASNIPALAVQPLLPALALRRPLLVKSSSSEPLFAPAFIAALIRREPRLESALAAVTWRGGDRQIEDAVFAAASRIVAYGGGEAMRDLTARAGDKLVAHGPKLSLAVISAEVPPNSVADEFGRRRSGAGRRPLRSAWLPFVAGRLHGRRRHGAGSSAGRGARCRG